MGGVFLREDQFITPGAKPRKPHPPVAGPSPRLMRPLKRSEPAPIKRVGEGTKANEKTINRLFEEHQRREQKRAQELERRTQADNAKSQHPEKLDAEKLDDFVNRHFSQALAHKEATER